jgi:predicted TIM-barrel fold metal-dependent hydrolase
LLELSGGDRRLPLGYSVPNTVPKDAVPDDLRAAALRYGPRAVKLHPNISGIDLQTIEGVDRVESILAACSAARMPLIVHGGRSPILDDEHARNFASLENLERVDWSRSREGVVIAHFGVFGCAGEEVSTIGLPTLKRILKRHDNVFVDTSGVTFDVLLEMLRGIDHGRIVFGSDALYFPMWKSLATLIHALSEIAVPVEESLARIAGHNARGHLRL